MRTRNKMTTTAIAAALALAGCGGGGGPGGGINRSDPEAVAKAYMESLYRCGERGAGLRAELAYPESAAKEHRGEAARQKAPGGCRVRKVKEFRTALVPSREPGIPAVVEVSNEDCGPSEVPMIKAEGSWLVDETEVQTGLICRSLD